MTVEPKRRSPHQKLDPGKVRDIRSKFKQRMDAKALAKEFGVTVETIRGIVMRRTWKDV